MSSFSGEETFQYLGEDLESLQFAHNYVDWILSEFDSFIGRNVLEVGAGIGTIAGAILERKALEALTLIEPDVRNLDTLNSITENWKIRPTIFPSFLKQFVEDYPEKKFDTIVYVNVLEHIENDVEELELAYKTLERGGFLLTFSPAMPQLYSNFDYSLGHYRRYRKQEFDTELERIGFDIQKSTYFDSLGFFGWFIVFKLLKKKGLDSKMVSFYDKLTIPFLRKLESVFSMPFGKNILTIAKRV